MPSHQVVDERPAKVGPDAVVDGSRHVDGRHDAAELPSHQDHSRRLDRDVGAVPDRQPEVRLPIRVLRHREITAAIRGRREAPDVPEP